MGYSISVLNNIRANASQEYQNRIPEATQQNIVTIGNALQNYELLFNEFSSTLVNKIGKTILETQLFENKLKRFKSGSITTQQDVEEIFVEMTKAEGSYDKEGKNPLGRRELPDIKTLYHRMNRQDYYVVSIGDIDFVRVFRSEATLDEFIRSLINSVYSGAEYDEWLAMKNLMATYNGYFDYEVPKITAATAEASAKTFVKTLRKAINDLTVAPSDQYNAAGALTWSKKENLVLFVNKDVVSEVDVEVLAKAFNLGKTDIETPVIVMDDFGSLADTYALLIDKNWFRVWDTLSTMRKQDNAQGLFSNYFYHIHQILSASRFKNAVRFKAVSGS